MAKAQHYISQFYLRGFSRPENEDQVYAFDKKTGKGYPTHVKNAGHGTFFYAVRTVGGKLDKDSVETFLGEKVESPAVPAFNKIRKLEHINEEDYQHLLVYIVYMLTRVPKYRERVMATLPDIVNSRQEIIYLSARTAVLHCHISPTRATQIIHLYREAYRYILKTLPSQFFIPEPLEPAIIALSGMEWVFLTRTEPPYFITSDNPFVFDEKMGMRPPGGEILFPISKNVLLWARWENKGLVSYRPCSEAGVAIANARIFASATRVVYSHADDEWFQAIYNQPTMSE